MDSNLDSLKEEYEGDFLPSISDFDKFLKENQHLFVLIGVFGSVSAYMSRAIPEQSNQEIPLADISMFSGFGITFLLCAIILYKIGIKTLFDKTRILTRENAIFLVFGVMFVWFISVIFYVLIGYKNVIVAILITAALATGMFLPFLLSIKVIEEEWGKYIRVSTPVFIFCYSTVLFYSLTLLQYHFLDEYSISNYNLEELESLPADFLPVLGHIVIVFAAGSFGILMALSFMFIIYMLGIGIFNTLSRFVSDIRNHISQ